MNVHINQLVDYFSEAPVHFVEAYTYAISAQQGSSYGHTSIDSSGLVFTLSGAAYITIDGAHYKLEQGVILHASAKMKLTIHVIGDEPWNYTVVNYRVANDEQEQYPLYSQNFVMHTGCNINVNQQLTALVKRYEQATPYTKLQAKSDFYQLIRHALHAVQQQTTTTKTELMLQAVQYMHESYNKPISVTQISQHIGVERRRFAYLFERYTGMTPNHYLTNFRMKRSRELLRAQHYTVAQVAELVGYHDSFYFSRVFKKYNGVSPSDYRKKLLSYN